MVLKERWPSVSQYGCGAMGWELFGDGESMDVGAGDIYGLFMIKKTSFADNNCISSFKIREIICDAEPPSELHHKTHVTPPPPPK